MADIYHLIRKPDWEAAKASGVLAPASLEGEGFIHFCFDHQLQATANRFFHGVPDLLAVRFDGDSFGDDLKIEDSYGHGEFPHVYTTVPADLGQEPIDVSLLMGFFASEVSVQDLLTLGNTVPAALEHRFWDTVDRCRVDLCLDDEELRNLVLSLWASNKENPRLHRMLIENRMEWSDELLRVVGSKISADTWRLHGNQHPRFTLNTQEIWRPKLLATEQDILEAGCLRVLIGESIEAGQRLPASRLHRALELGEFSIVFKAVSKDSEVPPRPMNLPEPRSKSQREFLRKLHELWST